MAPAARTSERRKAATIVNPARLDKVRADDVCIQCHSQGKPRINPIEGRYYDWPVGYQPGDRLADVWELEEHHLGQATFTHWPEGTAHKNRMQGNDYVQSQMYVKGVQLLRLPRRPRDRARGGPAAARQRRLHCSATIRQLQPGPRGTLEFHTQQQGNSEGSKCVACHMPAIQQTIAERQCPQPYVQVHFAGDDGTPWRAEPLHHLS